MSLFFAYQIRFHALYRQNVKYRYVWKMNLVILLNCFGNRMAGF